MFWDSPQKKLMKKLREKKKVMDDLEKALVKNKEEMISMASRFQLKNGKLVKSDEIVQPKEAPIEAPPRPIQRPEPQRQHIPQEYIQPQAPRSYEPPQQFEEPIQRMPVIHKLNLVMITGQAITININAADLNALVAEISNAISDQAIVQIGQYFISGRNILYFIIE